MSACREHRPQSLREFVALLDGLREAATGPLWYRGTGLAKYELLPTLYRHPSIKERDDLAGLEARLLRRFRERSIPFHSRPLTDDWSTLFFMQHYGVPTRLLDWTESPFVGLHFAVMSAPARVSSQRRTYRSDAAVWVLDPTAWNRQALSHQSYNGGILVVGDDALKGYTPAASSAGMNNHPVAMFGSHNSPRIVAQRGVFTIFGQNLEPMEKVFDTVGYPPGCLEKLILTKDILGDLRDAVLSYGVTESVVFPDLPGLGREIRREHGFRE